MSIPEIPPFNPAKRKPPPVVVAETAGQSIPMATSPTPSQGTEASAGAAAKLNPKASTFVFKPNPTAAAFKPVGVLSQLK
jgi:hypothetical protein